MKVRVSTVELAGSISELEQVASSTNSQVEFIDVSVECGKVYLSMDCGNITISTSVSAAVIKSEEDTPTFCSNKTFENFIVGESNRVAYGCARELLDGEKAVLFLYGPTGLGKTHLLHAIANEMSEEFPTKVVRMTTAISLINEMVDHIKNNRIMDFRRKYSEETDVLIVDDVNSLSNKERSQEELFHIFNDLFRKNKQLVFTSDKIPAEIEGLKEKLKTRLQWGKVIPIDTPDYETRFAILEAKAMEFELELSHDVIDYIASSLTDNVRELEGALLRLTAYSDHIECEIDLEMAKEYLQL